MRYIAFVIIIFSIFSVPLIAQVDTLQLVEIGNIQASSEITNLYVQDLDGDSLKEIILTTADNVHIYDGITYEPIWTSPDLDHPGDLLFADINNDGYIDFSEKDSTNIRLFDPHNDEIIWTSPNLDSTYKCYTIGDRNDDGWTDIAIVKKEPFTRIGNWNNLDTVWVDLANGPGFDSMDEQIVLMSNYHNGDTWGSSRVIELPVKITFNKLTGNSGLCSRCLLFTWIIIDSELSHPSYTSHYLRGQIWLFDSENMQFISADTLGAIDSFVSADSEGERNIYTVSRFTESIISYGYSWQISRYFSVLDADSIVTSELIFDADSVDSTPRDWNGSLLDRISPNNPVDELCFLANDSLKFYGISSGSYIWETPGLDSQLFLKMYIKTNIINGNSFAACRNNQTGEFDLFDTESGGLHGIILNPGLIIPALSADPDNDGNDVIFRKIGNEIDIYDIAIQTGVTLDSQVSNQISLSANYPNPFNASTTIEYNLPQSGEVTLEIFDLLGRKVISLVGANQQAGQYSVTWNAKSKASGIYFYRIKSGEFRQTRRMVLLK